MKILFSSYAFHPAVGGIESVSAILAHEFTAAGHDVELVTETPGEELAAANYRITRQPSLAKVVHLLRWCDLLFQNNISLRILIPALVLRKRALIVHQTWIQNPSGKVGWKDRLKRTLLNRVANVAISQAVADHIGIRAFIIGNPYRDGIFHSRAETIRDKTLVFLGRLVSDKGADLLLRALSILAKEGLRPDLTIIGKGPEEENLRRLARELGLDRQISFVGEKTESALAEELSRHRILVVPSRWAEPFGIVALEGIACGCVVVGSEQGGLKQAIGPCGLLFQNGNVEALAERLKDLLGDQEIANKLRYGAPAHLERFRAKTVAAAYLELMQKLVA